MKSFAIGVEININIIKACIVDLDCENIIPETAVFRSIDSNSPADYLIKEWGEVINEVLRKYGSPVTKIGIAIPGPFDYEKGISLMKGQQKFEDLYGLNIKKLLAKELAVSSEDIRMQNTAPCFLSGEVIAGAAKGYKNILGYTLDNGFGSAQYTNGVAIDSNLWNAPFKEGIAEDYFDIKWIARKYEQYLDVSITSLKQVTDLSKTDGGIAWLVFNEYGENFAKFITQYIKLHTPDLLLIGGNNDAWGLFIPHVKDRLYDSKLEVPIKQSILGDSATLIGAGFLWNVK